MRSALSIFRRLHLPVVMSVLSLFLMASRCGDDEDGAETSEAPADTQDVEADPLADPAPQPEPDERNPDDADVMGADAVEPDPGLGVDGIELDGPIAPQEGDGSTPDEPSFEPSGDDF